MKDFVEVKGYHGKYLINKQGEVYDTIKKIILKTYVSKKGYVSISLNVNGITKHEYLHRLLAIAFIPNPDKKPQVNHKDENPTNNDLSNLEWMTAKENVNYSLYKRDLSAIQKKVCQIDEEDGTIVGTFNSIAEASRVSGIHRNTITRHCKNQVVTKSRSGFTWIYI